MSAAEIPGDADVKRHDEELLIPAGSETVAATRYEPTDREGPLPVLLCYTPYRKDDQSFLSTTTRWGSSRRSGRGRRWTPAPTPARWHSSRPRCLTPSSSPGPARCGSASPRPRPIRSSGGRIADVAPDGSASLVTYGRLRASHRESHEDPEPLTPGEEYGISLPLDPTSHVFEAGHRIRLAVAGAYFPFMLPTSEHGASPSRRRRRRPR